MTGQILPTNAYVDEALSTELSNDFSDELLSSKIAELGGFVQNIYDDIFAEISDSGLDIMSA